MKDDDRNALKSKILSDIETLKTEMESLKEQAKPVPPDNAIGRLTRMDAIQARSVAEAVLTKAAIRKIKLETALNRIDDDEYGTCKNCGEDISIKRMELVPEAVMCVNCAERL
ncbi:MAG: dksA/traR C4-type zinc finger family protein [bacterium]|nr:MAG: dksA/traR C4-type zinc finger family protein [bacterium]